MCLQREHLKINHLGDVTLIDSWTHRLNGLSSEVSKQKLQTKGSRSDETTAAKGNSSARSIYPLCTDRCLNQADLFVNKNQQKTAKRQKHRKFSKIRSVQNICLTSCAPFLAANIVFRKYCHLLFLFSFFEYFSFNSSNFSILFWGIVLILTGTGHWCWLVMSGQALEVSVSEFIRKFLFEIKKSLENDVLRRNSKV